ncbi:MAG: S-layer homology domain-containing protein [Candidatus Syntrophopropionicum ammoniitolerans]
MTIVAGYGSNVDTREIAVMAVGGSSGSSGGGGSSATPQPVASTTGTATITPSAGGTISLGSEVKIMLPANALMGKNRVEVKIEKTTVPPNIPAGFKLAGDVYEFSVDGQSSYNFNKNVALTFSFDPSVLSPGEIPSVYYYDEAQSRWVNLGGTVSGSVITVQVDHLTKYAVLVEKELANGPVITMKDIAGHWAEGNINGLVSLGPSPGIPTAPSGPTTASPGPSSPPCWRRPSNWQPQNGKVFTDTANHWARDYIATAAANGIVSGYDDSVFGPDDLITREQMAVMVVKAAGLSRQQEKLSLPIAAASPSGPGKPWPLQWKRGL